MVLKWEESWKALVYRLCRMFLKIRHAMLVVITYRYPHPQQYKGDPDDNQQLSLKLFRFHRPFLSFQSSTKTKLLPIICVEGGERE